MEWIVKPKTFRCMSKITPFSKVSPNLMNIFFYCKPFYGDILCIEVLMWCSRSFSDCDVDRFGVRGINWPSDTFIYLTYLYYVYVLGWLCILMCLYDYTQLAMEEYSPFQWESRVPFHSIDRTFALLCFTPLMEWVVSWEVAVILEGKYTSTLVSFTRWY